MLTAAKFQFKIVQSTAKILSNLNANFVVASLSGFVGETHISANLAIKDSVKAIMSVSIPNSNCLNVKGRASVQWEEITGLTEMKKC